MSSLKGNLFCEISTPVLSKIRTPENSMNSIKDEAYCSTCGKHKQFLGRPICFRCEELPPKNEIPPGNPGHGNNEVMATFGKFFDDTSFMDQEAREHIRENYCDNCKKITNQWIDVSLTGSIFPDNVTKVCNTCYCCDLSYIRYCYPDGTEFNLGR